METRIRRLGGRELCPLRFERTLARRERGTPAEREVRSPGGSGEPRAGSTSKQYDLENEASPSRLARYERVHCLSASRWHDLPGRRGAA